MSGQRDSGRAGWWVAVRGLGTLAVVLVAYYVLPDDTNSASFALRSLVFGLCVLGLAGLILFLITRKGQGSIPARAEGLLLTVVVSIIFFATVYYRLARDTPGQFSGLVTRTDGLYFTLTTTSTVGYGDIHAAGQTARIAVMINIAFNLVFLGAGVSVALDRIKQRRRSPATTPESTAGATPDDPPEQVRE